MLDVLHRLRSLPLTFWARTLLVLGGVVALTFLSGIAWWAALIVALVFGLWQILAVITLAVLVDGKIMWRMGDTSNWPVLVRFFPLYKHADMIRAIGMLAKRYPDAIHLQTEHRFALGGLLRGGGPPGARLINLPTMISYKIGPDEEEFFPADTIWLVPSAKLILRVHIPPMQRRAMVEIAAPERKMAEEVVEQLSELAVQHSIYRNQTIRVTFGGEAPDRYGDQDRDGPMELAFVREQLVTEHDIVLDEQIRGLLERTVVDFHHRRDQLAELGLPRRRGVLFYGPPGTGKTHTCRYLVHRLKPITTIVVAGHALLHMKAICAIARAFQPALVLLEDVDLVFSERQTNFNTTVLGEFLDQLDGFAVSDEVIFILTTNALDRVEAAIKDRPGRVSQVIYFGKPGPDLRRRYIETLLKPYNTEGLDLMRVVNQTDGVSQAFLKELVIRVVQLASAMPQINGRLVIDHEHIDTAIEDMISGGGKAGRRIIGFQVEA